jgi:hypothetical protein
MIKLGGEIENVINAVSLEERPDKIVILLALERVTFLTRAGTVRHISKSLLSLMG